MTISMSTAYRADVDTGGRVWIIPGDIVLIADEQGWKAMQCTGWPSHPHCANIHNETY
jgi:hypothetical protein